MRNKYRRKYNWNLLGKHCGPNIIGRLDWINGKPMVWIGILNFILLLLNMGFDKSNGSIPEVNLLVSHWGWYWFNQIAKILFWILFIDGMIVNFLWSFTRGQYHCSYFARLIKYPTLDNKSEVKETLAWAWFLFKHPEIDYKLQEALNSCTNDLLAQGKECEPERYRDLHFAILKKYGVQKDEKGRYFTWNDRKYRKMLEKL